MFNNYNFGGGSGPGSPGDGAPLGDIERDWIEKAIKDSSNEGTYATYEVELNTEFNNYRTTSNLILNSKIANLTETIANKKVRLEELTKQHDEVVKSSRRARKTHHMKKLAPLKRERKELEREIKQLRKDIMMNDQYLREAKRRNSAPTIRLSKYFFWSVCGVYVLAASFFNVPIFSEIFGDKPIFMFAAPIFGIVEGAFIHILGLSYGMSNRKVAKLLTVISGTTLICLIIGQMTLTDHGIYSAVFLTILFLLGIVTSYIYATSYFERVEKKLQKQENILLSKLHAKNDDIEILETERDDEAENDFDDKIAELKESISDNTTLKNNAEREKRNRIEQLNQTEESIKTQAKSIFDIMDNFE